VLVLHAVPEGDGESMEPMVAFTSSSVSATCRASLISSMTLRGVWNGVRASMLPWFVAYIWNDVGCASCIAPAVSTHCAMTASRTTLSGRRSGCR
jgi:hypothetical protein